MSGLGPLRSKVCADIGCPHSGHAFSARCSTVGAAVVSYGPTAAGPASANEVRVDPGVPASRIPDALTQSTLFGGGGFGSHVS